MHLDGWYKLRAEVRRRWDTYWECSRQQCGKEGLVRVEAHPLMKLLSLLMFAFFSALIIYYIIVHFAEPIIIVPVLFTILSISLIVDSFTRHLDADSNGVVMVSPWKRKKVSLHWNDLDDISYDKSDNTIHIFGQGAKFTIALDYMVGGVRFAQIVIKNVEKSKYLGAVDKINELASRCADMDETTISSKAAGMGRSP